MQRPCNGSTSTPYLMHLVVADLFKVRQTLFLVLSGVAGYFIGSLGRIDLETLLTLTASLYLSISGTTGLNMYFDRDIDGIMERTKCRSLPSGKISTRTALLVSLAFLVSGLALAYMVNVWVFIAGFLGFVVDIFLYTVLLKRRTALNIVLGSIAGGMPAFGGYVAATGAPEIGAFLLGLLIAEWAIVHIWYISSFYVEDYIRSRVPMLPAVYGFRVTSWASIAVLILIIFTLLGMYMLGIFGKVALASSLISGLVVVLIGIRFARTNRRELAKAAYKALNVFLGVTLLAGMVESLLF